MSLYEKLKDWVNTTNIVGARFWLTAFAMITTTVVYCLSAFIPSIDWEPSIEWLMWMATMSGLDVGAYWTKRITHVSEDGQTVAQKMKQPVAPTEPTEDDTEGLATTDIQELLQDEKG